MSKQAVVFLIISFTILGGFIRFYKNISNPPSLSIDEVSYGYSAYSILKTARDENGVFLPLIFKSTGDYKNPLLIYSLVPSIALFGLNEFSIRFINALIGTLSIPLCFFLFKALTKSSKVALIGSLLFAISPMSIYYSRFAHDALIGLFILMLGMLFFFKMLDGRKIFIFPAAITLALSLYAYHSSRLFVPLFLISYSIFKFKLSKNTYVFWLIFLIGSLPLIFLSIFGGAATRASTVFLSQDIDYTRYVVLDHVQRKWEELMLISFWIKRYLNYLQPEFLFFNGLNMTTAGTLGLGIFHLFELPWLLIGIVEMIKKLRKFSSFVGIWILAGVIPASLANNEHSASRTLIVLPPLILIISLGAVKFWKIIGNIKKLYLRWAIIFGYMLFTGVFLLKAILIFGIHFPIQRGEAFMEGTKESTMFAISNKDKYQEIVYDPYRGIEAPYIVNIPYMYFLFYSMYDPSVYQNETKIHGEDFFSFNKFTYRRINWREDRAKKGTLFIGSPWSLPLKDIKEEEILKKIYLSNGDLALLVVSPN